MSELSGYYDTFARGMANLVSVFRQRMAEELLQPKDKYVKRAKTR